MLSSRVQYALIILEEVLKSNGIALPKLKTISDRYDISIHFLEQVARDLRVAGLIKSVRGPGGGYKKQKDQISLLDVLRAVDKKDIILVSEEYERIYDFKRDIEQKLKTIIVG